MYTYLEYSGSGALSQYLKKKLCTGIYINNTNNYFFLINIYAMSE